LKVLQINSKQPENQETTALTVQSKSTAKLYRPKALKSCLSGCLRYFGVFEPLLTVNLLFVQVCYKLNKKNKV
jgi:hypothetical protein